MADTDVAGLVILGLWLLAIGAALWYVCQQERRR